MGNGAEVTLVFFREDTFYPIEIPLIVGKTIKEIARDNAKCNPGTIRVEDLNGHVLWQRPVNGDI